MASAQTAHSSLLFGIWFRQELMATSRDMLPIELVARILDDLDLYSVLECRTVCSAFRDLIDTSPHFQWQIKLAVAGKEDGELNYPLATRCKMLEQYQQSWESLRWTHEQRLQVEYPGFFWTLHGGIILSRMSLNGCALCFKKLPSLSRNIAERDWSVDIGNLRMGEFGIDSTQGLLVILEVPAWHTGDYHHRIHLRTLSTGDLHPLAVGASALMHAQHRKDEEMSYSIQICGDTLAIRFSHGNLEGTEVVLWNWKTGEVLSHIVDDHITSMVFLSERHIMIGVLYSHFGPGDAEPQLVIVDFIAEPAGRRELEDLENAFTFGFPSFAETAYVIHIDLQSNPSPTWTSDPTTPVPFFQARRNRLCTITLLVGRNRQSVRVYALCKSLLSLIEKVAGKNSPHFDWDVWGPDNTRMMISEYSISRTWVCYVYGTRHICASESQGQGVEHMNIYDFNQSVLRYGKREIESESNTSGPVIDAAVENSARDAAGGIIASPYVNVTAPTKISGGEIFQDEVETRLGYRVQSWVVPGQARVRFVMCSEDGIVIVYGSNRAIEEYHVLTV